MAAIFECSEYVIVFVTYMPFQPSIKFVKQTLKGFYNAKNSKSVIIFPIPSVVAKSLAILYFSLNKSFKTCLRPILQPGVNFTYQFAKSAKHLQKVNFTKNALLFHQNFCWNFIAYLRLQHLHWVPYFCDFMPNVFCG